MSTIAWRLTDNLVIIVVTAFKMKAYRYPSSTYAGMIAYLYNSLEALSQEVLDSSSAWRPKVGPACLHA